MTQQQLDRLFEAHVQHELATWHGEALAHTLSERVHAFFRWFAEITLEDVLTQTEIVGVIDRYVIAWPIKGGITELNGELSQLVFNSRATTDARLDEVLTPEMYREFADKVLALDGVRRELIVLIAQSSTVRELSAQMIARAVLDLLVQALPLPGVLAPPALSALSSKATSAVLPALEQLAKKSLAKHRERASGPGGERLIELLDSERLRSIVDELWDRVSSMRLSELFAFVQEQDIEDFVVLVHEFWVRYRKSEFFRRISIEAIEHFFRKYGKATLSVVIDDLGVTEQMVSGEALRLLQPILDQAARSGALESGIRGRLEAFYRSGAARAAFDR